MLTDNKLNIGEFTEVTFGKCFTYCLIDASDIWAAEHGFTHKVDVLDGYRYAKVKKTVVHIVTDEDSDGNPVIETWKIKRHVKYN